MTVLKVAGSWALHGDVFNKLSSFCDTQEQIRPQTENTISLILDPYDSTVFQVKIALVLLPATFAAQLHTILHL